MGNAAGGYGTVVGGGRAQASGEIRGATASSFDVVGLSLPNNDARQVSTNHTLMDTNKCI